MLKIGGKMNFKELIKKRGYSQYTLAKEVGKSHTTIYSWCKGICEPDCKSIVILSKVLNVSVEELVLLFANKKNLRRN